MNSIQAKQINLPGLMQKLGYKPTQVKKNGQEYWYQSPFRTEKDASFHTSFLGGKWIWNDFGDTGGTIIDFVMRHQNFSRVKDALSFLDTLYPQNTDLTSLFTQKGRLGVAKPKERTTPFSFQKQDDQIFDTDHQLEFIKAQTIENPLIYSYLEKKRGIPRKLAQQYLEQVHYRHKASGRTFFAIGIKNQSNGYEIRIASDDYGFTKSSLGGKDITIIPGIEPGVGKANLFEGMIDCLSLMAMYNASHLKGDCIILNTAQHASKAVDFIRSKNYEGMNSFLDNDRAGEECLAHFQECFGADFVFPQNELYEGFKDVNQALMANLTDLRLAK